MKNVLILLFFLSSSSWVHAQKANYREIDLPVNVQPGNVDVLYTDQNGFIWMAAGQKVFWHDGNEFRSIQFEQKEEGTITSIYRDTAAVLWIGWNSGNISTYDREKYSILKPQEGTPKVPIINWTEDANGQLWYATNGEGVYVKNAEGRWYNINLDDGLPSNEAYDMEPFEDGVVVATDQGIAYCSLLDDQKDIRVFDQKSGLSDQIVKSIHVDERGLVAAYYEPFVNLLDTTFKIINKLDAPGEEAKKVSRSSDVMWWLAEGGTLYRKIGKSAWEPLEFGGNLRGRIKDFTEDEEGHLWVLSARGILMIDQWYSYNSTENTVSAIWGDGNELWYAQQGNLIRKQLFSGEEQVMWEGAHQILSIWKDQYNTIWFGTFDGGLYRFDPRLGKVKVFKESEGLANNNVLSISGTKNTLWIGTLGGVSRLDLNEQGTVKNILSYNKEDGVSVQYIYSIHTSNDGTTYIGTDGEGVLKWNGKSFESIEKRGTHEVVLDLSVDEKGNVWWVNSKGVLFGYSKSGDKIKIPPYPEEPGKVSGLQILKDGSLLIIHEGGLHRWIPEIESWMVYGKSFGLANLQPELHSYVLDESNILHIGSAKGITSIVVAELPLQAMPETWIGRPELFFKSTDSREFSSTDNHLTFKYIGRWYGEPTAVRYSVKLDGFDPDWIESKNTEITYPKLPPGEYTFNVIAGIDGYYPKDQLRQTSFVIHKPWYLRWYSILIGSVLLLAVLMLIFRLRLNMLRQKQEREKQKVQAQLETLKSQVNPHFLFNSFNTLMALIEDDREEATEYLSDLSDFFRSILEFRDVDLITVGEDVRIVETYLQLQGKRFGENLRATISLQEEVLKSFIPPLTLQLLVENAFKHNVISKDKPLELRIESVGDFLKVINRYHPRAKTEESTGYGLDSIKKKYKYYSRGKSEKVIQTEDYFEVHLPIIDENITK